MHQNAAYLCNIINTHTVTQHIMNASQNTTPYKFTGFDEEGLACYTDPDAKPETLYAIPPAPTQSDMNTTQNTATKRKAFEDYNNLYAYVSQAYAMCPRVHPEYPTDDQLAYASDYKRNWDAVGQALTTLTKVN